MTAEEKGPIESKEWPKQLRATAISPDSPPRFFGYDVEGDLARHYSFSDTIYLALKRELPEERIGAAFGSILVFASAMSVARAPIHAAALARLCGVRIGGVLAVAATSLVEDVAARFDALDACVRSGKVTPDLEAASDEERASVARLKTLVDGKIDVPLLAANPGRELAIVAVLHACGFESRDEVFCVLAMARLPSAAAEALATKPGDFKSYPMDVPHFEYVAPAKEGP